jgi:hypothetical protein
VPGAIARPVSELSIITSQENFLAWIEWPWVPSGDLPLVHTHAWTDKLNISTKMMFSAYPCLYIYTLRLINHCLGGVHTCTAIVHTCSKFRYAG